MSSMLNDVATAAPIQLVCFDLGGVVMRICRSWEEGCVAAGLEVRCVGNGAENSDALRALVRRHQTGLIACETYARELSALLGGLYSPDEVLAVHHAWTLGEYEGVGEVVNRIHEAGVETAALSNTSHSHWQHLLTLPVVRSLTHRAASHLMGLFKPDPEIYRAFESHVNREPHEILFFDDLPENVAAAREAGWSAEHIDHSRCTATQIEAALTRHGVL